jgi:hypothetical protein
MSRWWLCALSLLVTACAPSGDDPFSRLDVVAPATNEYRVYYLRPPWELVSSEGTTSFLRIRSNRMVYGGIESGPGKYDLLVTVEPGTPASRVADEMRLAASRGETITAGPRSVTTNELVMGQELLTSVTLPEPQYFRYVYLPLDASRVVRLAFEATPNLESAEADAMIRMVGIGPE